MYGPYSIYHFLRIQPLLVCLRLLPFLQIAGCFVLVCLIIEGGGEKRKERKRGGHLTELHKMGEEFLERCFGEKAIKCQSMFSTCLFSALKRLIKAVAGNP